MDEFFLVNDDYYKICTRCGYMLSVYDNFYIHRGKLTMRCITCNRKGRLNRENRGRIILKENQYLYRPPDDKHRGYISVDFNDTFPREEALKLVKYIRECMCS